MLPGLGWAPEIVAGLGAGPAQLFTLAMAVPGSDFRANFQPLADTQTHKPLQGLFVVAEIQSQLLMIGAIFGKRTALLE